MKNFVEQKQAKIFRQMSADKKIKMVDDFYRYSLKLQQNDNSKVRKSNKLRLKSA